MTKKSVDKKFLFSLFFISIIRRSLLCNMIAKNYFFSFSSESFTMPMIDFIHTLSLSYLSAMLTYIYTFSFICFKYGVLQDSRCNKEWIHHIHIIWPLTYHLTSKPILWLLYLKYWQLQSHINIYWEIVQQKPAVNRLQLSSKFETEIVQYCSKQKMVGS